jgi:hypothetical protein
MPHSLRAGALGAFARSGFNLLQPLYIVAFLQVLPDGAQYDPAAIRTAIPLLYVEPVLTIGMALGLVLAVWTLFDLMADRAPAMMRLSLLTAGIAATALFFVAGNAISRFDSLFLFESYSAEQQGFALHILDMFSVTVGHVLVASQGISTLLWSLAGWHTRALPRRLSGAGLVLGILAILFEFTPANLIGFLIQVPLFIWLGVVLWRMPAATPALVPASAQL